MDDTFRVPRDSGNEEADRFWDEEFAVVLPPRNIAADLEMLTRPIPEGDPSFPGSEQFDASMELNETLSSLSLSLSSSSSSPSSVKGKGKEETPDKGADADGNSTSFTPFSPNQRPAINQLTVYSDSGEEAPSTIRPAAAAGGRGGGGRRPFAPQSPTAVLERFARRTRDERDAEDAEEAAAVIETPLGPRKLVPAVGGRGGRGAVLIDSSNRTLAILRGSEVRTFSLNTEGATLAMGGDKPTVEQTRDGYTVTFSSMIIRETKKEQPTTPFIPRVGTVGRSLLPFRVWTEPEERAVQPVPLGVFEVESAYFVGTYKGDLVGKRECGMMYSTTEAAMTVIQSNHPDFSQQKSHFVISFAVDRNRQTLFQVALHKRLWAHSWARGQEDVYFPRVPVLSHGEGGGGPMITDVGIRIWATVFANKKGARDPVTRRPLTATVAVRKIVFELPLSVSQFIVAPRTARKANIFADDDDDDDE